VSALQHQRAGAGRRSSTAQAVADTIRITCAIEADVTACGNTWTAIVSSRMEALAVAATALNAFAADPEAGLPAICVTQRPHEDAGGSSFAVTVGAVR